MVAEALRPAHRDRLHHEAAHAHRRAHETSRRRLGAVLALTLTFLVVEAVGATLTNSLALLADAGHMLSDVAALSLALVANWYAARPPTARRTYGHVRAEVLAALANGLALAAVAVFVFVEAIQRLGEPPHVQGQGALLVATAGLAANLLAAWLLHQGGGHNLNEQGALLHVLSDALGSLGAMAAGALVWLSGWSAADALVSILIGLLVLGSSASLLRRTLAVLMEAAPSHIDPGEVGETMARVPGVATVHDLHVWTVASGFPALSAHVEASGRSSGEVLHHLQRVLRERFGLEHVTLQVESCEHPRDTACCEPDPRCLVPLAGGGGQGDG